MTDNGEQLREVFEAHATPIPDPVAVYARVQQLSRTYRRRRRGAQVAGTAVLGAGLIAGAINLPSALAGLPMGPRGHGSAPIGAPATSANPKGPDTAPPSMSPAELQRRAYYDAGYGYEDAVKLAELWHVGYGDLSEVKTEAGRRLMAGESLPFAPSPENLEQAKRNVAIDKFFEYGYDYEDAVKLAQIWKLPDPFDAKISGGERLMAGQQLPFAATHRSPTATP